MSRLTVNLASEPFINRVVPLAAMAVLAFLAVSLTVTNLTLFAVFGGEYRKLRSTTARQQTTLAALTRSIQDRKKEMASPDVASFMGEAEFLDQTLKAKAFSWTLLLTRLEEVKAYGVMLQSVNPQVGKGGTITVLLRGVANPHEELLKFENNLFSSRHFRNTTLRGEQKEAANPWYKFDLVSDYGPDGYPPQPGPPPPPPPMNEGAAAPPATPAASAGPKPVQGGASPAKPVPGQAKPPAAANVPVSVGQAPALAPLGPEEVRPGIQRPAPGPPNRQKPKPPPAPAPGMNSAGAPLKPARVIAPTSDPGASPANRPQGSGPQEGKAQ